VYLVPETETDRFWSLAVTPANGFPDVDLTEDVGMTQIGTIYCDRVLACRKVGDQPIDWLMQSTKGIGPHPVFAWIPISEVQCEPTP
jgi:hypothetical protein